MQGCKKQPYPCYFKDGSESRVFIAHEHHQQHPHHVLPPIESLVVTASVIGSAGAHAHHELISCLQLARGRDPGPHFRRTSDGYETTTFAQHAANAVSERQLHGRGVHVDALVLLPPETRPPNLRPSLSRHRRPRLAAPLAVQRQR